nr:unnamed protein product [Haemonchus contortus]
MSGDFFYQGIEREHTMAHEFFDVLTAKVPLEADDTLLKDIMQNSEPFEGKMMIFGGDFHHVVLVIEHGGRQGSVEACVNESALWSLFTIHHLDVNMGTRDAGNDWHERPLEIGNGNCNGTDECVQILEKMMCSSDIVTEIFVATLDSDKASELYECAILRPKNDHIQRLNDTVLDRLRVENKLWAKKLTKVSMKLFTWKGSIINLSSRNT